MTYNVAYGDPVVLAVRGLSYDRAIDRAKQVARDGRPNVRITDEDGKLITPIAAKAPHA